MLNLNLSELIRYNNDNSLNSNDINQQIDIKILSNITINQIIHPLKYLLNRNGINSKIHIGEYDNIIQESNEISELTIPIIFWEPSNFKDSFVYEIEKNDTNYKDLFFNKIKNELDILFDNLSKVKLVIFNEFSHIAFTSNTLQINQFEELVQNLNKYLLENKPKNFFIVSITKIISNISVTQSIDYRNYYTSKSLYTFTFLKYYVNFISPLFLSLFSKSKKILVLDCDNTLWNGIVGEDGIEGIGISDKDKNGIFFKEIQLIAKSLKKNGVLLALCSKNNYNDVEEVFQKRTDLQLYSDDFVKFKINWNDKASNLVELSNELNIGIDSFVFIDDSDFEISLINDKLPEVETIQVPKQLFLYPQILNSKLDLFFKFSKTQEDLRRAEMYRQEEKRVNEIVKYSNIDDYLSSLELEININIDDIESIDRISQLTQKTNQFNLCTKRYSSVEISKFMNDISYNVFSLEVSDKFGDSGITGICFVSYNNNIATIDNLLLSCRVLGRNIEIQFLNEIIEYIFSKNNDFIQSRYIKTFKNEQVSSFYEKFNFNLISNTKDEKNYNLIKSNFKKNQINYINTLWKRK
jgi:FkbH-like protein